MKKADEQRLDNLLTVVSALADALGISGVEAAVMVSAALVEQADGGPAEVHEVGAQLQSMALEIAMGDDDPEDDGDDPEDPEDPEDDPEDDGDDPDEFETDWEDDPEEPEEPKAKPKPRRTAKAKADKGGKGKSQGKAKATRGKLEPKVQKAIERDLKKGKMTQAAIAEAHGVSRSKVWSIKKSLDG